MDNFFTVRGRIHRGDVRWGKYDASWRENKDRLIRWVKLHNRIPSTKPFSDKEEKRLARWMWAQRAIHYKGNGDLLWRGREKELEAIPWWTWGNQEKWYLTRDMVAKFVQQHGRYPKDNKSDLDETKLATWTYNQRSKHKRGKLDNDAVDALEQIPGWGESGRKAKGERKKGTKRRSRFNLGKMMIENPPTG